MDLVPDAPPFMPEGLPTATVYNDIGRPLTRMEAIFGDESPKNEIFDSFYFHLFSVDVMEKPMVAVPEADLPALVCMSASQLTEQREIYEGTAEDRGEDDISHASVLVAKVYVTGHLLDGRKVGFVMHHRPSCQVELPEGDDATMRTWFRDTVIPPLAFCVGLKAHHISVSFHYRCRFLGYVPDPANPLQRKTFLFAQLNFPNTNAMQRAAQKLRGAFGKPIRFRDGNQAPCFAVHEDGIDAVQKFLDAYSLEPSQWHKVTFPSPKRSRCSRELLVDLEFDLDSPQQMQRYTGTAIDTLAVPSLCVAVLDAEMDSPQRQFPRSSLENNRVVAISVVLAYAGKVPAALAHRGVAEYQEFERHVFVLSPACEAISGVIVHLYEDEFEMIAAIRDLLFVQHRVDVLSGHNLIRFDMEYLASRIVEYGSDSSKRFLRFGVLFMETANLQADGLSSSAFGTNRLAKLNGAGFAYVDTMLVCKQSFKLRENSLKMACSEFLGSDTTKFDMPYDLIPDVSAGTDPVHWRKLAAYCVQDSVLVLRLLRKWDYVKDMVAQSRIMNILCATNVQSGQQARVRNYVMKDCRLPEFNMVMTGVDVRSRDRNAVSETAVGGYVLEAVPGLHDKPVCVLDFASLYPSVQMKSNLCWSTVDLGDIKPEHEAAGLVINTIETPTGTFRFVANVPGVFPQSLKSLKIKRNDYKRLMTVHPYGSAEYQNANNAQKAIKIPMNSGYGVANCPTGKMPCRPLGTSTCFEGRLLNQAAEKFCRETFGTQTLYGDTDSIFIYFPEPPHVASGTRKVRLQYAMKMGQEAERRINAFFRDKFGTDYVKVEHEKVYFPLQLNEAKKSYAGVHYDPGDEEKMDDDLLTGGGRIEAKGMRIVRRDVPMFIVRMTEEMLNCLFYKRDEDAFWDVAHTYMERMAHGELSVDDYVSTAELKAGYQDKAFPHVQAAVAYAREYAVRGSMIQDGDRVPFVFVEEIDPQRMIRPPWLDEDVARAHRVADSSRRKRPLEAEVFDDEYDVDEDELAQVSSKCAPLFMSTDDDTTNHKKAMHARHPDEVKARPDINHIDIEHYADALCTVLKQLMPDQLDAQKELLRYAAAHKRYNQSMRGKCAGSSSLEKYLAGDGASLAGLPKLSHRRPPRKLFAKTMTILGGVTTEATKAKKPAKTHPSKKAATPAKQHTLKLG